MITKLLDKFGSPVTVGDRLTDGKIYATITGIDADGWVYFADGTNINLIHARQHWERFAKVSEEEWIVANDPTNAGLPGKNKEFKIGDKVLCIQRSGLSIMLNSAIPYKIVDISPDKNTLYLEGVEGGYAKMRFKPYQDFLDELMF